MNESGGGLNQTWPNDEKEVCGILLVQSIFLSNNMRIVKSGGHTVRTGANRGVGRGTRWPRPLARANQRKCGRVEGEGGGAERFNQVEEEEASFLRCSMNTCSETSSVNTAAPDSLTHFYLYTYLNRLLLLNIISLQHYLEHPLLSFRLYVKPPCFMLILQSEYVNIMTYSTPNKGICTWVLRVTSESRLLSHTNQLNSQ